MTQKHEPAMPPSGQGEWADPQTCRQWKDYLGLTAIEYAAIHTGQPCSGTAWLDEMIAKARRERLAGQILQSLVARDGDDSAYGLDMVKARPLLACDYTEALIAALEGDEE